MILKIVRLCAYTKWVVVEGRRLLRKIIAVRGIMKRR
jgi:hypothetical protein